LDIDRDREARARAEAAVVAFFHELGDFEVPIVLLGGLVPELLTAGQTPAVPPHLGTTDADLLIDMQVAQEADLSAVERCLNRLGYAPENVSAGWRWLGSVAGSSMKMEFLCELDDQPAERVVLAAGCRSLGAMNLRGTGYVREDFERVELTGTLPDGRVVSVRIPVAGLGGYLLAKGTALRNRGKEKDYYDFIYVLLYNRAGGPAEAARALLNGPFRSRLDGLSLLWKEIAVRFADPRDAGPVAYATQALQVDPLSDAELLRQDAVGAVADFLDALLDRS
jgi:hypothetical protein